MKNILRLLSAMIFAAIALTVLHSCGDASYKEGGGGDGGGGGTGTGGSMARFTICGDYIYTVDQSRLKVTRIKNPANPEELNYVTLTGFYGDIETIFPYDNKLFIGSRSAMYIYDISNPLNPRELSVTSHIRSCDPVVAYGNRAYVTLNNVSINCGGSGDHLLIFDIRSIMYPESPPYYGDPYMIYDWRYTGNIHPAGLGVDGPAGRLFVCTNIGVEVWEINDDPSMPELTFICNLIDIEGVEVMDAYDVIPLDGLLIVIGQDGLYQFDYSGDEIIFLSSYKVKPNYL